MLRDRLQAAGIAIKGHGDGHYRTQCPQCSSERHKKRDKCLSVSVEDGGERACWLCHHCGWKGGVVAGEAFGGGNRLRRKPGHLAGDFGAARRRFRNHVLPAPAER